MRIHTAFDEPNTRAVGAQFCFQHLWAYHQKKERVPSYQTPVMRGAHWGIKQAIGQPNILCSSGTVPKRAKARRCPVAAGNSQGHSCKPSVSVHGKDEEEVKMFWTLLAQWSAVAKSELTFGQADSPNSELRYAPTS